MIQDFPYRCTICGQGLASWWGHPCGGTQTPPLLPKHITYQWSEEAIRQIIREEIERAKEEE